MPAAVHDILLCQRFVPEHGGSIRWMHEVYRRWPGNVEVVTHDYYRVPIRTPEFPTTPAPPNGIDHVTDVNLKMDRRDIWIRDWGVESVGRVRRYLRMTRAINERLRDRTRYPGVVRVHAIHAVPEVASLIPLRWRYGKRLQIICYAHGEEITACCSSRQLRFLMRRAHRIVDLMIANSKYTAGLLREHMDPAKIAVVHPGVELAEFNDAEQAGLAWRKQCGLENKMVVLTVGRLDPRKNHAAVIEAIATLKDRRPTAVYALAGDGRQMNALKELAGARGVADRVLFLGAVGGAERRAIYGACDVFAMPAIKAGTDVEGFGLVFLEAAACGKPTIAGTAGGQAEAVVDGTTGLVVDGTDASQVAGALDRLLGDAALRRTMGDAGRSHAAAFDWAKVVERTVDLVERISGR